MNTQVYKGTEYEIKTGELYYIVANNAYEPYFGQYELPSGKQSEGVAVVTGSYIMTKEDGIVPVNITSQGAVNGETNPAALGNQAAAEINRLTKLVASQHQQIVGLQQQLQHQQITPANVAAQQMVQPARDFAELSDPFTDQLEAAAAAGNRQAA